MSAATASSIEIREVRSVAEIRQVEELQRVVWGVPDIEVVPLSQLIAATSSGGVLLGAFDGEVMAGFTYGFVGFERGRTVHHSHMLAVLKEYRSHDLGFKLKAAQCEIVIAQGIDRITWTFDPLQSLNAHFNFGKLGAVSDKYYVNYYGEEAASFLHQNGTDRLWVTCLLKSDRVREKLKGNFAVEELPGVPSLVAVGEGMRPLVGDTEALMSEECTVIEIPSDINSLEQQDRELAGEWRRATRNAFTRALDAGFIVEDFRRVGGSEPVRGAYVLRKNKLLKESLS